MSSWFLDSELSTCFLYSFFPPIILMGIALITKHVMNTYQKDKSNSVLVVCFIEGGILTAVR